MGTTTSKKLLQTKNSTLKSLSEEAGNITQSEVLLLNEPKPTDELYRTLGVPSKADFVNEKLADINEITVYDKTYDKGKPSFKGYHIKEMCEQYALLARPLSDLEGYLPVEAMKAIQTFSDDYEKAITGSSFYILAPYEYFKKTGKGKECTTYVILFKDPSDTRRREYNTLTVDDIVTQIYSSGNDFKESRKLKVLLYHTEDIYDLIVLSTILGVFCTIFTLFNLHFIVNTIMVLIYTLLVISVSYAGGKISKCWNSNNNY